MAQFDDTDGSAAKLVRERTAVDPNQLPRLSVVANATGGPPALSIATPELSAALPVSASPASTNQPLQLSQIQLAPSNESISFVGTSFAPHSSLLNLPERSLFGGGGGGESTNSKHFEPMTSLFASAPSRSKRGEAAIGGLLALLASIFGFILRIFNPRRETSKRRR